MKQWRAGLTPERRAELDKLKYARSKARGYTPEQRHAAVVRSAAYLASLSPERRAARNAKRMIKELPRVNARRKLDIEKYRAIGRAQYAKHAPTCRARQQEYRDLLKAETFAAYGAVCVCCGEDEMTFLTIDHIKGDGALLRRDMKHSGSSLYAWLKKNNFPAGYQTLCFNCNLAKRQRDECPHKRIVMNKLKLITGGRP